MGFSKPGAHLWLAGNQGMELKNKVTIMGYVGTTCKDPFLNQRKARKPETLSRFQGTENGVGGSGSSRCSLAV